MTKNPQAVSLYPFDEDHRQESITQILTSQRQELQRICNNDDIYQVIMGKKKEYQQRMDKFRNDNKLQG